MPWTIRTALAAALAIVGSGYTAQASFFSYPRALILQLDKSDSKRRHWRLSPIRDFASSIPTIAARTA